MNSLALDTQAKLLDFKKGVIDLASFQQWVDANQDMLQTQVSPGILLKLRRADMQKVMSCISSLIHACQKCCNINTTGRFTSRQEFSQCASHVDNALANGVLKRIKIPNWVQLGHSQLGADAYYECTSCNTVWTLVEPEHEDNGLWDRLN